MTALRRAAGVTQEGWAARLGYARRTIQRWEGGESPPDAPATEALVNLCDKLALFHRYNRGPLAGKLLGPDELRQLLAEARQVVDGQVESTVDSATTSRAWTGTPGARHNLPAELTTFIGRERERIDVSRSLHRARLVTIVGVGGVGKTRLALRVAADRVDDFPGGVWLIELGSLAEPALIGELTARVLGVGARSSNVLDILVEALRTRNTLLVFDNCEHLIEACAALMDRILRACPGVRVLATSREPLAVSGEDVWRLPPLPTAPAENDSSFEAVAGVEAVRLFVDRAIAARSDFRLAPQHIAAVGRICQRLDGIPLAVELAAARVTILSPEEIADRLDDRFRLLVDGRRTTPTRQQTLRATLDWSYELLGERDRYAFESLSIFPGSFNLAAASAVLAAEPERGIAEGEVNVMASLVAKSLVQVEDAEPRETPETRYRLLETVRAYGLERLGTRGDVDAVRRRQAHWAFQFVEEAECRVHGPEQSPWLRRITRELPNLHAALAWAVESQEVDLALGLVGAQAWYWFHAIHGTLAEGRLWLERGLALPAARDVPHARLKALAGIALLSLAQGDRAAAWARIQEELALAEEVEDDAGLLAAHGGRAQYKLVTGEFEEAERIAEKTLDLARKLDETWVTVILLANQAYCALHRGDRDRARACFTAGANLARDKRDTWSLAMALGQLGDLERTEGAHERAGILYKESLALNQTLGLGERSPSLLHNLGYVALARDNTSEANDSFTRALMQFHSRGERRGATECVIGLGCVAAARHEPEVAARLFGAGDAALEDLGAQLWPSNRPDYDRWVSQAKAELSVSAFEAMWSRGRRMSLSDAITLALERKDGATATARG
ncbi:MAG TPA: helix-turn-helix domain-containing protein [Chloroflexota bacterium]